MLSRSPFIGPFMVRPRFVAAVLPVALLMAMACGEGAAPAREPARMSDGGMKEEGGAAPGWAQMRPVTRKVDDAAPPEGAPSGGGRGNSPDAAASPACVPAADPDVPDDDFADTNCDGIDGDAASAVFVAPGGADDADGTREAPVKTLAMAVSRARDAGKAAIYACAAIYEENLVLSDPIAVHGGFDCARGWARVNDVALVRSASGPALRIDKGHSIAVHRMAFESVRARSAGESSIAVVVSDSEGIAFQHVEMKAGDGGPGKEGVPVAAVWGPVRAATPGTGGPVGASCRANAACTGLSGSSTADATCHLDSLGGSGDSFTCPDRTVVQGGPGGRGGNCGLGKASSAGADGMPAAGSDGEGRVGAKGVSGKPSPLFGRVVDGGYVPPTGAPGGWGGAGSAGRGGDGHKGYASNGDVSRYFTIGGGGGQGGYPGCGGAGGEGGGGGGASVALLVERSTTTIVASRLVTGRGGDGGAPARGASGQPGGAGAKGASLGYDTDGAPGHQGGDGGEGGSGGPGAGGPSIGVVFRGEAPVLDDVTSFDLGEPGIGATGSTSAPDGLKERTYAVQEWVVTR